MWFLQSGRTWLKALMWAESDSYMGTGGLWTIFCFLSITVTAPAVIYAEPFVWITLVFTVSGLLVLPVDVLSILQLHQNQGSMNTPQTKGNGCEETISGTVQLCDAEAARYWGCRVWFRRVWSLRAPPCRHQNSWQFAALSLCSPTPFEVRGNLLRKRKWEWKYQNYLTFTKGLRAFCISPLNTPHPLF